MNQNTFYLLLIIILIILLGGMLFYLNAISQTLKECCKNIATSGGGTCNIGYPPESVGGNTPNLLSHADGATVTLGTEGVFPLRADMTTKDCTIRVVIKTTDPDFQIGNFPNQHKWFARGLSEQEWEYFSYGPGVADGNINLLGTGAGSIEVYENGNSVPSKTINLQL